MGWPAQRYTPGVFVIHDYDLVSRPFDVESVPLVTEEPRFEWAVDFYDGPLSGVCDLDGDVLWFQVYADDRLFAIEDAAPETREALERLVGRVRPPEEGYRVCLLHRLRREELREEERWHRLFVRHVGGQFDMTVPGAKREKPPVHEHELFYLPYNLCRPTLDLSRAPVVAVWLL